MSLCLPLKDSGKCYGCGEPVCDSKVDATWHTKPHLTVEISLAQRPMSGEPNRLINPHYNFTVHSIECMKKVDWSQVEKDILESETNLMHAKWKDNKMGI